MSMPFATVCLAAVLGALLCCNLFASIKVIVLLYFAHRREAGDFA
jgi:hypothetical protein